MRQGGAVMPDFKQDVIDSLDGVAEDLTSEVKVRAVAAGWPEDVADKLSIVNEGGTFVTRYDGDEREYQSFELGDQNRLPNPVLHSFFHSREGKNLVRDRMAGTSEVIASYIRDMV